MSVFPLFLVLGKDGKIGAYSREDVLKCDLAQNFKDGEPARAVFNLEPQSMTVSYERSHDYDGWVEPLENMCDRHKREALPRPTSNTCVECEKEGQG